MSSKCQKTWDNLFGLKSAFLKILTIILSVCLLFLIPMIFFTISVPFGTLRYLIHKSAKCFRPDLGKMVTLSTTPMAIDSLYTKPKTSIVVGLILEGTLDLTRIRNIVSKNILGARFPNGEMKYPELKQYLTSWLGYYFWKDEKHFDLEKHVRMESQNPSTTYSEQDIKNIYQTLVRNPWNRKRSLWELILMPNSYPKGLDATTSHTILFLRVHHSIGDGK